MDKKKTRERDRKSNISSTHWSVVLVARVNESDLFWCNVIKRLKGA